jgi:hypothetical protein
MQGRTQYAVDERYVYGHQEEDRLPDQHHYWLGQVFVQDCFHVDFDFVSRCMYRPD